jgi:hypothetical protein
MENDLYGLFGTPARVLPIGWEGAREKTQQRIVRSEQSTDGLCHRADSHAQGILINGVGGQ